MSNNYIDGKQLYYFIISGAHRLVSAEQSLNKINFFPVADGDTGTNLAFTMRPIIQKAQQSSSVNKTLRSIADVALANAYGNSGIIFAQYLHGMSQEANNKDLLSIKEFAEMVRNAVQYAYKAVADPVEGTILTVMKGWSESFSSGSDSDGLETLFERSLLLAREMVDQTRHGLKVLRKNNVVDAGAKGFMIFVEGMLEFIRTKEIKAEDMMLQDFKYEEHVNYLGADIVKDHVYCSQFYMRTNKEIHEIQDAIVDLGDSMVVAGGQGQISAHLHTDAPEKVMAVLNGLGEVASHRIEDMRLQSLMLNQGKKRIGLVTDSIADLPKSIIYDHTISVIPMNLICDSVAYLDKITMTPDMFYNAWDEFKIYPTTAQPSVQMVEKILYTLSQRFDSIIGIFVSEKMSGTYGNVLGVAQSMQANGYPIHIIDSALNSVAQGLLVKKAALMISDGLEAIDIVERIESIKKDSRIYVMVDDLSYMLRGGRVSKTQGFILGKIKLKPVVSIDSSGKGSIHKKTRTEKRALQAIMNQVEKDFHQEGIREYALVYADDLEALGPLRESMVALTGRMPAYETQISPVVGLNAGRGAVAVGYIKGGYRL